MHQASRPEVSPERVLAGLREARRLLQHPAVAALEGCLPHLQTALDFLSGLEHRLDQGRPAQQECQALRDHLHRLRRELRGVDALLEAAAVFQAGLAAWLARAAESAAYSPQGQVEAPPVPARLHMEG